jgi:hypothetical protein
MLAAALVALNICLSFHNIWPTPWITVRWEISAEIAALVVLLGAYQRWFGPPSKRLIAGLTFVLCLLVLGRYMEVTAPALYGRAVNLYWDARYLPAVASMIVEAADTTTTVLLLVLGVAGACLMYWLLRWSLLQVLSNLQKPTVSGYLQSAMACLVALYFLGYYTSLPTLRWFSIPVTQTYTRQINFVVDALSGPSALESLSTESPLATLQIDQLAHHDVIITFLESYGAVAFDDESIATELIGPRQALANAIERTNRKVATAFIEAPTFGGGSWLSHISFMTGLNISSGASYDALLTQSRPTLPKLFREAGFRTVALMPGLKNQWPEGSFYGFNEIYGALHLDYSGPEFGWWRIPDQFALAKLQALELEAQNRAPVFAFFPTISTHMPFRPTPPYQPDWQRIAGATPYTIDELGTRLIESPDWSNLQPSYTDALAYTLTYWSGYLEAHPDDDSLLVLLGDHQPPAAVSGEGARWDVPVHVISRNDQLITRLIEHGFRPGLTPADTPIAQMHELSLLLLQ